MSQDVLPPQPGSAGHHLLADLGGTHARFAWVSPGSEQPFELTLQAAQHPGPAQALTHFLEQARLAGHRRDGQMPQAAWLAVASADRGPVIRFTNAPWVLDLAQLQASLPGAAIRVLNDFEALAWSLPQLQPSHLRAIGPLAIDAGHCPDEPLKAVMGPGTGLGLAACLRTASGWQALATEGGHATLAAHDPLERAILDVMASEWPHVSAERLLSGSGLPLLDRALREVKGHAPQPGLHAALLVEQALTGRDPQAIETLTVFCNWLGSFAGSAVLTLGARGGLFLGGGILPRIEGLLQASQFRERFCAKGRFSRYLEQVPTVLVVHPNPALLGLRHLITQA